MHRYYVIELGSRKVVGEVTSLLAAEAVARLFGHCGIETKDSVILRQRTR